MRPAVTRMLAVALAPVLLTLPARPADGQTPKRPACTGGAGLTLPDGFCAVALGQEIGAVRHLAVAPNGDVFAAVEGRDGGVVALRDADGDGRAETVKRFGPGGGSGIALGDGFLYFATNSAVVRWPWRAGQLEPGGDPETIVRDLPTGGHGAKSVALGSGNALFVTIGSRTNSCQEQDRTARSRGVDPCTELETRAGIWRFAADKPGQRQADGTRFATGLRNALAITVHPGTNLLYAAPHGRDQLAQNWGFSDEQSAELPAEEFMQANQGDDFGWPYCYYDHLQKQKVLAPEYGGDGKRVGRCSEKKAPLIGFPGHWAPMAIAFYEGQEFPASYQGGVFIAFHGSWNRAPLPQAGYRVVFLPMKDGKPAGDYQTFATSSEGATALRASGLAVGPDGSLYLAADDNQTIWRIMRKR